MKQHNIILFQKKFFSLLVSKLNYSCNSRDPLHPCHHKCDTLWCIFLCNHSHLHLSCRICILSTKYSFFGIFYISSYTSHLWTGRTLSTPLTPITVRVCLAVVTFLADSVQKTISLHAGQWGQAEQGHCQSQHQNVLVHLQSDKMLPFQYYFMVTIYSLLWFIVWLQGCFQEYLLLNLSDENKIDRYNSQ